MDSWLKNERIEEKSETQLLDLQSQFEKQLNTSLSIKQKIAITKAISKIKDQITKLQNPHLENKLLKEKQISKEVEV